MKYDTATVDVIAEHLKQSKANNKPAAILLGAGMSVTAGIPTAAGIIEVIKKEYPELTADHVAKKGKETYPAYMDLLAPDQRKKIIGKFIDDAKINLSHMYLSVLVKEGYVDRILTTNFDPLVVKSLAMCNIFPGIYNFAASQDYEFGGAADLSVFYLHGQRDGFVLLNTDEEVARHSQKMGNVFQDVSNGRPWLVIGYSGDNDPVFKQLAEITDYRNKLFWIGYNKNEPSDILCENILKKNKHGYYVKDYNADSFFLELARK